MSDPSITKTKIEPRLLAILVCPMTRTPLRHDAETNELISDIAGLAYPIENGTPILLIERASELPQKD